MMRGDQSRRCPAFCSVLTLAPGCREGCEHLTLEELVSRARRAEASHPSEPVLKVYIPHLRQFTSQNA